MNEDNENFGLGFDTTFELNDFEQPKILSDVETIAHVILFILFAKPGQYPSLPMIGMNIENELYSFYDELDVNDLKDRLIDQCSILQVYFDGNIVSFDKRIYQDKPSLLIHISGKSEYPKGYMKDLHSSLSQYRIGITFDELNQMIYNINADDGSINE